MGARPYHDGFLILPASRRALVKIGPSALLTLSIGTIKLIVHLEFFVRYHPRFFIANMSNGDLTYYRTRFLVCHNLD
jgi:hypothetical protein